mgnify:CR=1 FL=1|jgi:hypothetical protein
MSTNLNYIIRRNKSSLETFIAKNRLTSYTALVEYCWQRKFVPCTEEEYTSVVGAESKNEKKEKLERKASVPQKKRKARTSSKSKQNTSRVLERDDNGKN